MRSHDVLSIALIGPARFGITEPCPGGLERHTGVLARSLQALGHRITVYAGPATAAAPVDLEVQPIIAAPPDFAGCQRVDNAMPPGRYDSEDRGYRDVLAAVAQGGYDVVHNNSLHYLPPVLQPVLKLPMVHTLHTPPFDWLERAHAHRRDAGSTDAVVAVSQALRGPWSPVATHVVHNGVDISAWPVGRAQTGGCAWGGRIVPEKAPHVAIDAARAAGLPIVLAGPVQHREYFRTAIQPRLGEDARWLGHLDSHDLAAVYGAASVGVVTPQWDEPFGLVAAEMLACGTPVAAFDRGGLREIIEPGVGVLVPPDDSDGLAEAIPSAAALSRRVCRKVAESRLSATTMAARYVQLYREAIRHGRR